MAVPSPALLPDRNARQGSARGTPTPISNATAGMVHVQAYDRRAADGDIQHVQAHERGAPQRLWREQSNPDWREQIAGEETRRDDGDFGYGMRGQAGSSALGRYQLLQIPLWDAGWKDEHGNWTARARSAGVASDADFLANPAAQEAAMSDVMQRNEDQLRAYGANRFLNLEVRGLRGGTVPITEAGLAAAAHREGARAVRDYLAHRAMELPPPDSVRGRGDLSKFNEIERRLRAFAPAPYRFQPRQVQTR